MNSGTTPPWTGEDTVGYNPGTSNGPYDDDYIAEFEKLGTYKLQFTAKLTRATLDGDEDCDPDNSDPPVNQRFCASETYTFHVGPIAELEIIDGSASPHAAADRSALTVLAVNNGPDSSLGARVTGLPKGAEVLHISQGSYNRTTGVWNIGQMKISDYYRSRGEPEPTLVLAAAAGETANVTIENSAAYTVCIGSDASTLAHTTETACEAVTGASWHEGTVYDYDDGNNSATITAARGTGGVGPGIPANPRAQTGTTAVMWEEVESLYGLPVERYEVQWLGSTLDHAGPPGGRATSTLTRRPAAGGTTGCGQ